MCDSCFEGEIIYIYKLLVVVVLCGGTTYTVYQCTLYSVLSLIYSVHYCTVY